MTWFFSGAISAK